MSKVYFGGLAALSLSLVACFPGDDEVIPARPDAGVPPQIASVTITENPLAGLSATIEIATDVPTTASVSVTGADHGTWTIPYDSGTGVAHVIPVLGMRPERHYTFSVTVSAAGLETTDDTLTYDTAALPADFPPLAATVHDAGRVSPGVTLIDVARWNPGPDRDWGLLVALDEDGEVVWYYQHDARLGDVEHLSNGRLAVVVGDHAIIEIDAMGNLTNEWTAADLGLDSIHHEVHELPGGNLLTLSTELRTVDGYEGGGTSYDVVGDVAVELERNGGIVATWSTFDVLDPLRVRMGFHAPFWNAIYPEATDGTKDWTHGNAAIYDPADDSIILSLRHQDWLAKIDRETGNLVWVLGEDGDFAMTGTGEWQFHQHAPELSGDGSLLLFDNGNGRSTLGQDDVPFSRVVEYALDPQAMEVTQIWEYRNTTPYFAPFVGDADRLGNGNVLITDGGMVDDPAVPLQDPGNLKSARILEVTGEAAPAKVWEVTVRDDAATGAVGYHVYRADRLGSLYDAVD